MTNEQRLVEIEQKIESIIEKTINEKWQLRQALRQALGNTKKVLLNTAGVLESILSDTLPAGSDFGDAKISKETMEELKKNPFSRFFVRPAFKCQCPMEYAQDLMIVNDVCLVCGGLKK